MMKVYESKHYIFHYRDNSLAEKDIIKISSNQEKCFEHICTTLKIIFKTKIEYFLYDSPLVVGNLFNGGDEPINGFAVIGENKVYAVYNDAIKCIGPHEDAHIISSSINVPLSDFLCEGLAMYFDGAWWSIKNDDLVNYFLKNGKMISIARLIDNKYFYNIDCALTYPLAGSFTKYLIEKIGLDMYLDLYSLKTNDYKYGFKKIYGESLEILEEKYLNWIKSITIDNNYIERILNENN